MSIVYITKNKINNRKYLGKCVHDKPFYYGSGIALRHAIKKYGIQNFTKTIIHNGLTKKQAAKIEKQLSEKWNVVDSKIWYNLKPGGIGGSIKGRKSSDATKLKISLSKKGTPSWNKGLNDDPRCKHKKETIEKIRKANTGKDYGLRGDNHPSSKWVIFTHKEKGKFKVKGISHFCKQHNIKYSQMTWRLFKDKIKLPTVDGWCIRYA
jgi:hypothetical protein